MLHLTTFSLACLIALFELIAPSEAAQVTGWTYKDTSSTCAATVSDPCGPSYWNKVSGSTACGYTSTGQQSPIDISFAKPDLTIKGPVFNPLDANLGCFKWNQFASNSTFELSGAEVKCTNLTLTYGGSLWTMAQMHFHSPSEHSIGGGYYSAEVHMVHAKVTNGITTYLALGVMLQEAASEVIVHNNSFLQAIWNVGGGTVKGIVQAGDVESEVPINPYVTLLPARKSFYTYHGGFTAPPCSETVTWLLYDEPVQISSSDLSILRNAFKFYKTNILSSQGNNARYPSQPLNGREVSYYIGYDYPLSLSADDSSDDVIPAAVNQNKVISAISISISVILAIVVGYLAYKVNELTHLLAREVPKMKEIEMSTNAQNPMAKT